MNRKFIGWLILLNSLLLNSYAQSQVWDGFSQSFDVTGFRGGAFTFKGYVRTELDNQDANARLMARVDRKKGYGFFDNMRNRPITDSSWHQYEISGPIDEKAQSLVIGAFYVGKGKFYFDKFSLKIKSKAGKWQEVEIVNGDFEEADLRKNWKSFFDLDFETKLTKVNPVSGNSCLAVNTNKRNLRGKFLNANGIKFYYEQFGQGDTLFLLHGNSESIKSFEKQMPTFQNSFCVIGIDSRGQGNSSRDGRKISYELMAEDVNAIMDSLKIKNANVLGWSDGGNVGLILAMKYPEKVKRLATMGANLYNDETSVDEKINKQLLQERQRLSSDTSAANKFRLEMIDLLLNEPKISPEDLIKIKCETLVMAGSKDVIKVPHTKLIASKIKNSKLVIFEKGTHFEPWDNPERFNKTVIDFFKQNLK